MSDGHGPMTNLLIEDLHPAARLISGSNELLGQMEAIKRTSPAHFGTQFPRGRRGPRTIVITDTDYVRAFKLLWGMLIVALAVSEGLL